MKTRFSNAQEIAHIWAQQNQSEGRCANVFFKDTIIYSYGHHFPMANFITPKVVLFTSKKYSVTTAKHLSFVIRALHGVTVFEVPNVVPFNKEEHLNNLSYLEVKRNNCLFDAKKSHKNTGFLLSQSEYLNTQAINYVEQFDLGKKALKPFLSFNARTKELVEKMDKQNEKVRIAKELSERREKEEQGILRTELLQSWFNCEQDEIEVDGNIYRTSNISLLPECYLRINQNEVETSKGARVSLKAAKVLFEMIKQGKDIKGWQIDSYTVISLNGVLTIGCHKIERSEINRFAALQGWGQIEIH